QLVQVRRAGQAVLAIDVHGVRAAHAFATRTTQRETVVHVVLDAHEGIEQHLVGGLELHFKLLHVWTLVLVRIVAVDLEFQSSLGAHSSVLLRKSALWAGRTRPSAASTVRACTRGDCLPST